MEGYLNEMMKDLPEDMDGTATSPAAEHLFKTKVNVVKRDDEKADSFHQVTVKVLFMCKRGQPDIHTEIAFLCIRVKNPDQDNYKKLARVIKYLCRTKFMHLTMEACHLDQNHWFIDGAFAVHKNMRSHSRS